MPVVYAIYLAKLEQVVVLKMLGLFYMAFSYQATFVAQKAKIQSRLQDYAGFLSIIIKGLSNTGDSLVI